MYIKALVDYKGYVANHIYKCNSLKAKVLIKKGVAESVDRIYCIDNLYVAKLVGVKNTFLGEITDGLDMGYRVFTRNCESYFFDSEQLVYQHKLTGNYFYPDNYKWKLAKVKKGSIVVLANTVQRFSDFFLNEITAAGLTVEDYVSDKDLKRVELHLNHSKEKNTEKTK